MESKLQQLRRVLETNPHTYPTAYHLAILDGCYDVGAIESAMQADFFNYLPRPETLLDPFHQSNEQMLLSVEHIRQEEQLIKSSIQEAKELAVELRDNPGLASANRAIRYIQAKGRNHYASISLTQHLELPHAKNTPDTQAYWESAKRKC